MTYVKKLLSAGAAAALFAGAASAQILPIDYSHHWQPMHNPTSGGIAILTDGALFSDATFGSLGSPAGFGDAIRRCFGTDTTNGGRNQSAGVAEATWFRLTQAYGPASSAQQAEAGLVSITMASESDLTGDACFSPWAAQPGNTGGQKTAFAFILGPWGGPGASVLTGAFWRVAGSFAFASTTTTNFHGVPGPVTVGIQTPAPVPAGMNPLLANAIFEVQGPLNGTNHQYYLATTTELTGLGSAGAGTGGVTNGNGMWGSALTGATADLSGAVNHSRVIGFDDPAQLGSGALALFNLAPQTELVMELAWNSPGLWGINNGSEGAGGNDWVASTAPVSTIDLRLQDNLSGAQTEPTAAAYDACIVFNQPIFVWSATFAVTMQQNPMSWDDIWAGVPPGAGGNGMTQPGSALLGAQFTIREGGQRVPITFDAVTQLLLTFSGLSLGTPFTPAFDTSQDPGLGGNYIFSEGNDTPITSGVSNFSGGPVPIVGTPKPGLAGAKLGVAALGVQVDGCTGNVLLTEFANSLEINIQ